MKKVTIVLFFSAILLSRSALTASADWELTSVRGVAEAKHPPIPGTGTITVKLDSGEELTASLRVEKQSYGAVSHFFPLTGIPRFEAADEAIEYSVKSFCAEKPGPLPATLWITEVKGDQLSSGSPGYWAIQPPHGDEAGRYQYLSISVKNNATGSHVEDSRTCP